VVGDGTAKDSEIALQAFFPTLLGVLFSLALRAKDDPRSASFEVGRGAAMLLEACSRAPAWFMHSPVIWQRWQLDLRPGIGIFGLAVGCSAWQWDVRHG
jgi:hypothetical protein